MSKVEDTQLVNDAATDREGVVQCQVPCGDGVQTLQLEPGVRSNEPAGTQAIVELADAVEAGVGGSDL
jgi:hypothetical protein